MKRWQSMAAAACLGLVGFGCNRDPDAELEDIVSRYDRLTEKGERHADRYVDRIVNSVERRDRIAERIERRSLDNEQRAQKTLNDLRESTEERSEAAPSEWATRVVSGTVQKVAGSSVQIADESGAVVSLKTPSKQTLVWSESEAPVPLEELQPGTEVRASYEVQGGENVATELNFAEQ